MEADWHVIGEFHAIIQIWMASWQIPELGELAEGFNGKITL